MRKRGRGKEGETDKEWKRQEVIGMLITRVRKEGKGKVNEEKIR